MSSVERLMTRRKTTCEHGNNEPVAAGTLSRWCPDCGAISKPNHFDWELPRCTTAQLADMRRGYQALDRERLRHKAESDRRRELLSRVYMWRERGLPQGVAADIASELNGYLSDVYQAPVAAAPSPGKPDLELLAHRFLGRYGQTYLDWELRDLIALLREVSNGQS